MMSAASSSWLEGAHFESEYFLTLTYLPPVEAEERAKGWLFEGGSARAASSNGGADSRTVPKQGGQVREHLRVAVSDRAPAGGYRHRRLMGSPIPTIRLLRYSARSITGNDHPFARPDFPCYLNEVLAGADFTGGIEPRIGNKHIRVIAVDGFPKMSSPGILRELDSLPIEYRWSTRAILHRPRRSALPARHAPEEMAEQDPGLEGPDSSNPDRRRKHSRASRWPTMPRRR